MIQKLVGIPTTEEVVKKINEIIDFVDDEQPVVFDEPTFPKQETYEEGWLDKICRFYDDPNLEDLCSYGLLCAINPDDEYPFVTYSGGVDVCYRYCKPVSEKDPDFYKGATK